nr:hypothetical protein [Synechocystis sp. PCC 6803]
MVQNIIIEINRNAGFSLGWNDGASFSFGKIIFPSHRFLSPVSWHVGLKLSE